jgi:molybdate transport system ATP-binding protein
VEERRVTALLARLGIAQLAERRFLTLSYGERRLVLIARALASRPRLLLLDEVANGLDARNHGRLLLWLSSTARSSMPWVFATHRRGDVPEVMTHLLELEQGRVTRVGAMRAARARGLLKQEQAAFLADGTAARAPPRRRHRPLVTLRHADVYVDDAHILRGIELEIAAGDCWVVHGPNGSGKSTLLRTIYGDHGVPPAPASSRWLMPCATGSFKLRTAYGPHLRDLACPKMPVMEVVASGRYASIGLVTPSPRATANTPSALRRFGIYELRNRTLAEMSYGQARRVLFARLGAEPKPRCSMNRSWSDRATRADLTRRLMPGLPMAAA